MSDKVPCTVSIPADFLANILLEDPAKEPRVLGKWTADNAADYEEEHPGSTIELTLEQVGCLFRWAWIDADTFFDMDCVSPDYSALQVALSPFYETNETLMALVAFCAKAMDMREPVKIDFSGIAPCPFCGGKATYTNALRGGMSVSEANAWMAQVLCSRCGSTGGVCTGNSSTEAFQAALKTWNKRA